MEFAVGITTLGSLGGQTRNPYDPARYPGGSSGGTGAAVAASLRQVPIKVTIAADAVKAEVDFGFDRVYRFQPAPRCMRGVSTSVCSSSNTRAVRYAGR